jgi:Skp family chaperone for outer membrane proteins
LKIKRPFYFGLALLGLLSAILHLPAVALEIPLDRTTPSAGTGGGAVQVGYVDIEKVFAEHPLTRRYRAGFSDEVNKRKKEISEIESQISALEKVIVSSTTEISLLQGEVDSMKARLAATELTSLSTATVSGDVPAATAPALTDPAITAKEAAIKAKEAGVESIRGEIAKKRSEIPERIRLTKADLARLEEKQSAEVLADIYYLLEKVASEEGLTIIFDKDNILFGQSAKDVTQKVIDRLQGR